LVPRTKLKTTFEGLPKNVGFSAGLLYNKKKRKQSGNGREKFYTGTIFPPGGRELYTDFINRGKLCAGALSFPLHSNIDPG
jgi:hypothetical protein